MKRRLLLLLLALLLLSPAAYAHPGRTDASGGHTDSATGEYHYHHGYPAHQHYDMDGDGTPDCPYLFKTAVKTTPATTSATSSPLVPLKVQTTTPASSGASDSSVLAWLIFSGICLLMFVFSFAALCRKSSALEDASAKLLSAQQHSKDLEIDLCRFRAEQETRYAARRDELQVQLGGLYAQKRRDLNASIYKERQEMEAKCRQEIAALNTAHAQELAAAQKQIEKLTLDLHWSERRRKYVYDAMVRGYGENFLLRAAGAPPDLFWDSKGFPHLSPEIGLDPYTLHRSSTGKFHRPECPHSYRCTPVNALQVSREEFQRNRCQVCQPVYPDLSWADELNNLLEYTKF